MATMMTRERQSLTTRQMAESLGVSESSVKRWVDDGTIAADRTAGGHRRIPMAAAIGYIRRHHATLTKPHLLALESAPRVGKVDDAAARELLDAMVGDRSSEARAILTGRYIGGADIASIADGLIKPVLQHLGELWHQGSDGILLEHRAVDTCVHALAEIGAWLPSVPDSAPAAVTAGSPGDPYILPPMLTSLVLREGGMRAHNLGPATPLETIRIATTRYSARLCSVSFSASPRSNVESELLELERQIAETGGRLVVGGRCSGALSPKVRDRLRLCTSMTELAAYATGWLEGAGLSSTDRENAS